MKGVRSHTIILKKSCFGTSLLLLGRMTMKEGKPPNRFTKEGLIAAFLDTYREFEDVRRRAARHLLKE